MSESNKPSLSVLQCLELSTLETDIREHLATGRKGPPSLVLVLDADDESGELARLAEVHVEKVAAAARYCASEGITPQHFYGGTGALLELPLCHNAACIVAQQTAFFAAPESMGYAVLIAAGFKPPAEPATRAAA
jgi:hypothetical protein